MRQRVSWAEINCACSATGMLSGKPVKREVRCATTLVSGQIMGMRTMLVDAPTAVSDDYFPVLNLNLAITTFSNLVIIASHPGRHFMKNRKERQQPATSGVECLGDDTPPAPATTESILMVTPDFNERAMISDPDVLLPIVTAWKRA